MKGIVINLDSRPDRWELFQKRNQFPFPVERFPGIVKEKGEDGCTASHLMVIATEEKFPFIVFEDDCIMLKSWDFVENAMKQLPGDWDALWLGANPCKKLHRFSQNLFRLKHAYCLHAVMYNSKRMVDYILANHNTLLGKNLDIFYRKEVLELFNCYITYPITATQDNGFSNISNRNQLHYDVILNQYKKYTHHEVK